MNFSDENNRLHITTDWLRAVQPTSALFNKSTVITSDGRANIISSPLIKVN